MKKGVLKRLLIVLSILAVPVLLELDHKFFNHMGIFIAIAACLIILFALVFFLVVAWIINPDVFKETEETPEEKKRTNN